MTVNAKPFSPLLVLPLFAACAQTPAPESALNFDDCLITHMAVISMLEDTPTEEDANLRAGVIKSQTKLLADESLDEDDLAQRTSTLMRSYAPAADAAIAEAIGTAPQILAAEAIFCQQELAE